MVYERQRYGLNHTAKGTDLMCEAPSPVPDRQLAELGIGLRAQAAKAIKKTE
jgi:aspartyl-tRNA synthetase